MNIDSAVKAINDLLIEKRPDTFNSSWIRKHAPHAYRYIRNNIRTENGSIDWDRVTRSLDRKFYRKWQPAYQFRLKKYRRKSEVEIVLKKYHARLYVFISPTDKGDENIRDIICISLVRIAQKGNILAREEIIKLVRFTIDEWIETRPALYTWEGHESLINDYIKGCIRRYRYSGTFMGYLLKTMEYAGRGLPSTSEHPQSYV